MAEKRKPRATGVSPRGVFKYPKLTTPDYGSKEYPCPEGQYDVRLILMESDAATQAFIKKLQPHYDEAMAEGAQKFAALPVQTRKKLGSMTQNDLYTTVYDKETEEPTGEIEFRFKMAASGVAHKGTAKERAYTQKPDLFDAKGLPIKKAPDIWGGTVGKVSYEIRPYFINGSGAAGLKLALKGAQIIELVSGGQKDAKGHGFSEEDGYSYDPAAAEDETSDEFGDSTADDASGSDASPDF